MDEWRPDSRPEKTKDVVFTSMPPETVLLNLDSGFYYSTNEIGAEIWELCDGGNTVGEITARLCDRYDAAYGEIKADVVHFLTEMAGEGLLKNKCRD